MMLRRAIDESFRHMMLRLIPSYIDAWPSALVDATPRVVARRCYARLSFR